MRLAELSGYEPDWVVGRIASENSETTAKATLTFPLTAMTQSIPITVIDLAPPLPMMNTWSSLRRNVYSKDEPVLHHLPYTGEVERDEGDEFYDTLFEKYDLDSKQDEKIDDECFMEMVKVVSAMVDSPTHLSGYEDALLQGDNSSGEGNQPEIQQREVATKPKENPRGTFPPNWIFQVLSQVFPKHNSEELKTKFEIFF